MDILKPRCPICGWPLAESREKGCVEGDCAYRPDDPAEQRRIKQRREQLPGYTIKPQGD